MSLLTANNLGQSFGAVDIFAGISLSIPDDGKIGLVGPNGVGKSSLLRILAGISEPATGEVHLARGTRLGFLAQEAVQAFAGRENSVYEEMLSVFADLRAQEARLREMEEAMGRGDADEGLVEQYGAAQERFEMAGGYDYDLRIRQVLAGLGFQESHWESPLEQLSGGQKTRALLARLLLEQPDILILDEPTNHLDVGAVEWLENTLRGWEKALLVVSHDRYFLDNVVNRIWEMSPSHIELYRGNYSAYVTQRQERWERQEQLFRDEKERLEKELDYIKRNIAGQNTDQAKGRLKRLSRDLVAIETVGILGKQGKSWSRLSDMIGQRVRSMTVAEAEQQIRALREPNGRPPRLKMRLQNAPRSGDIVLRAKGLKVGYPGAPLFAADQIELERGECAALIGPNGAGKSTFLRTVLGQLEPLAGEVRLGASLKIGYFAQAHDALRLENRVIDELIANCPMQVAEARHYLAQYLFREDDVYKPVSALSGGERGRLALAILARQGANFLLLDEPTNHLDIPAQEVLQEVLEQFGGTILLVSHDRYLVSRLATQIWELRDGRLHVFQGSYQELMEAREQERALAREAAETERVAIVPAESPPTLSKNEQRRRAERLAAIEQRISEVEALLDQGNHALQEASERQDFAEIQRLSQAFSATQGELERLMEEWEQLADG